MINLNSKYLILLQVLILSRNKEGIEYTDFPKWENVSEDMLSILNKDKLIRIFCFKHVNAPRFRFDGYFIAITDLGKNKLVKWTVAFLLPVVSLFISVLALLH